MFQISLKFIIHHKFNTDRIYVWIGKRDFWNVSYLEGVEVVEMKRIGIGPFIL